MVVPEFPIPRVGRNPANVDAAVLDAFNIPRSYWQDKDEKDDLRAEMNKKFADRYDSHYFPRRQSGPTQLQYFDSALTVLVCGLYVSSK
jgi:hypothetical protein